jgi:uncharacterized protein (TIGR03437 family)
VILPAGLKYELGGVVGEPLAPGEAPTHQHSFDMLVRLGSGNYYHGKQGNAPVAFLDGGTVPAAGITEASTPPLPVAKLLLCRKTASAANGVPPRGVTAFFDQPGCPQGWRSPDSTVGRFLVGLPPDAEAAAFGSNDPIQNLEVRTHTHLLTGTFSLPRTTIGKIQCRYCNPQKDALGLSPGGPVPYTGEAAESHSGLPYIQLLHCEKQGPSQPQINSVVHAASFAAGPVAPGEIVSIFVDLLPGVSPASAELDTQGRVASQLAGVSVLFNEIAAPLFFVNERQINAQVPYEMAGRQSVIVRVLQDGLTSDKLEVPAAAAAPALFAYQDDPTHAVALDARGALNSADNPAAEGDILILYATGEGQTTPPQQDGQLAAEPFPRPLLDIKVWIGGREADVAFAGSAPGFAGLLQLNVRVPAASGPVEVQLQVGEIRSGSLIVFAR